MCNYKVEVDEKMLDGLAHELFPVYQLKKDEGIKDAVNRAIVILREEFHGELTKAIYPLKKIQDYFDKIRQSNNEAELSVAYDELWNAIYNKKI